MDIANYSRDARKTDGEQYELAYYFLKLGSEAGEVQQDYANYLKKKITFAQLQEKVQEELGDVMWYWVMIHSKLGLDPSQTMVENIDKLKKRYKKDDDDEDMAGFANLFG